MKTFVYVFLLVLFSIFLGAFLFYVFMFLTWGRILSINTGFYGSIFITVSFFIWRLSHLIKKEGLKKVLISNIIVLAFLAPMSYIYVFKDNSKFYSYNNYPCKIGTVSSESNIILLSYAGSSMKGFDILTKYNLEDENYYNIIKKTTSHMYKKTYPAGSKWKVLGLYEHTKYHLNYFLLRSVDDKEKAWIYTDNFNYRECKLEALNREAPFEIYSAVGSKKSIKF